MSVNLAKYNDRFFVEAEKYIKSIWYLLLESQKIHNPENLMHGLVRDVHTLKSLFSTMNHHEGENLCYEMESLLILVQNRITTLNKCFEIFFQCDDYLNRNLQSIRATNTELESTELIKQLKQISNSVKT